MGIQNFPTALQPIIQQGFLEREFEQALHSRLGYRAIADREEFAIGIGETVTKTRAGLKPSVTTPMVPATNTNLDNGLTPQYFNVEQYTITINSYAATTDLNMVTSGVAIASMFLQNAAINGEQAARSLDELARNALFAAYFGGNTRVTTTLGSAGPTIAVDDVRGFQYVYAIVHVVDAVAMVTREPIDRLQQIVAQSWYWIGGFCAPSHMTTNPSTIPTATNATFKRAVMIEHVG